MRFRLPAAALAAAALAAAPGGAQLPSLGNAGGALSSLGGASGLLGGGLPAIGSTGMGNAAGLLGYCLKNQLLQSTAGTNSTLGALTKQPNVTASSGYAAGQSGTLVTGQGQSFSMDSVSTTLKTKMCGLVLKHAKSLLVRSHP